MRIDFKKTIRCVKHHSKILFKGFVRMMYGTATAGLLALAVYGFAMIPTEDGYIAVCDFIGSVATAVIGVTCMWDIGRDRKKGVKK